jgi:hypothetical protein
MRILKMSRAVMRKGSKTGTRRYTDSRENEDMEAILPVPKNPTCNNTKKKSAILASDNFNFRNEGFDRLGCPLPFMFGMEICVDVAIAVSSSFQITRVAKKMT